MSRYSSLVPIFIQLYPNFLTQKPLINFHMSAIPGHPQNTIFYFTWISSDGMRKDAQLTSDDKINIKSYTLSVFISTTKNSFFELFPKLWVVGGSKVLNLLVKIKIKCLYGIFDNSKHNRLIYPWMGGVRCSGKSSKNGFLGHFPLPRQKDC